MPQSGALAAPKQQRSVTHAALNNADTPLLHISHLSVGFSLTPYAPPALATEDVTLILPKGKVVCLVGESGCGKSVVARSILRLLPSPPAQLVSGAIYFAGNNTTTMSEAELQHIRGNAIGMVFQEPMTSLNPVLTIGTQVSEHIALHKKVSQKEAQQQAIHMLHKVGIINPQSSMSDYPHQLSGGMRQRVMIAIAMACSPQVLIADEPTTALDVTLQQQILGLMQNLVQESQSALLLITHDFGVVSQIADIVAVMYAGKIVEQGSTKDILDTPLHPYTQGLLASRPHPSAYQGQTAKKERLHAIAGTVPALNNRPTGCYFHPRCPHATDTCRSASPTLPSNPLDTWLPSPAHVCACWLHA